MKWQQMGSAPTDKPVLLNVGYSVAVIGHWNEYVQSWAYSTLQSHKMETGDIDVWFENEIDEKPLAWCELPEV
jgi:hypothetical protein